jgi:hypothetical protein
VPHAVLDLLLVRWLVDVLVLRGEHARRGRGRRRGAGSAGPAGAAAEGPAGAPAFWGTTCRRLELREPRMSWVWSGEHDNEAGARTTYALVAAKVG